MSPEDTVSGGLGLTLVSYSASPAAIGTMTMPQTKKDASADWRTEYDHQHVTTSLNDHAECDTPACRETENVERIHTTPNDTDADPAIACPTHREIIIGVSS